MSTLVAFLDLLLSSGVHCRSALTCFESALQGRRWARTLQPGPRRREQRRLPAGLHPSAPCEARAQRSQSLASACAARQVSSSLRSWMSGLMLKSYFTRSSNVGCMAVLSIKILISGEFVGTAPSPVHDSDRGRGCLAVCSFPQASRWPFRTACWGPSWSEASSCLRSSCGHCSAGSGALRGALEADCLLHRQSAFHWRGANESED